jgi:hypothetical protein
MGKMQDKPLGYYQKFHAVICGLDSVPARRWINSTLVDAVQKSDDGEVNVRGVFSSTSHSRCLSTVLCCLVVVKSSFINF